MKNYKSYHTSQFCNNCGKFGHIFQNCKKPIISSGLITFKKENNVYKYLMICRKDSLGFVDFMRGKYNLNNVTHIGNLIDEMTLNEKKNVIEKSFEELWKYLWGDFIGSQYKTEEKNSKDKFNKLKLGYLDNISLEQLISNSTTSWVEPEWGFPKGRREKDESDLRCAIREYIEETGHLTSDFSVVQNIIPYEEIFTGSNYKSYKHKYYLAYIKNKNVNDNNYQTSEVSKIKWCSLDECLHLIRPYSKEKKI